MNLAFQMPLYPMIDDRSNYWADLPANKITWSKQHGILAWHLLLKDVRTEKTYKIPSDAAPARAEDLSGLPPTLSYVGANDIVKNEAEAIAGRLTESGVTVSFRTFDNLFHAMEDSVPDAPVSQEVQQWAQAEFAAFVDRYCAD